MRIECYDISNTQGANQVASMVVCEKGQMNKQEYRRFKIQREDDKPNDFASMEEVIRRRLKESQKANNPKFGQATRPDHRGRRTRAGFVRTGRDDGDRDHAAAGRACQAVRASVSAHETTRLSSPATPRRSIWCSVFATKPTGSPTLQRATARQGPDPFDSGRGARIGPKRRKQLQLHFGQCRQDEAGDPGRTGTAPGMNSGLAEVLYDYLHDATRS